MLYWKSKCIFHTVYWGTIDCEWETTYVYFGVTYVCFIPRILPVFAVGPQYQHRFFLCQRYHLKDTNKILTKVPCWFQTWKRCVGQTLIKLETSFIWGFLPSPLWYLLGSNLCKHPGGHSVTSEACTSRAEVCVVWRSVCNWGYLRYVTVKLW